MHKDLVVIGGGAAGMSAALSAYENGIKDILIVERNPYLGGVVRQCIHNGFGVHRFNEDLTGTEFAERMDALIKETGISCLLEAHVINISEDNVITAVHPEQGLIHIEASAIILAMGCRERTRGALRIPGTRPAGIITAGTAQYYLNRKGYLPGSKVVILGSGDVGLIMARQLTLEDVKVEAVVEIMPVSGGLPRNMKQCIEDFGIPVFYNSTVTDIRGKERVTGITIATVDESRRPIPETEREIPCDTLLISAGLIPENELTSGAGILLSRRTGGPLVDDQLMTSREGVFACGNVLYVHGLVDQVAEEGARTGVKAAQYLNGSKPDPERILETPVPAAAETGSADSDTNVITCINCPIGCKITVEKKNDEIVSITGNRCARGEEYARQESVRPMRVLTTLMRVEGREVPLSVKSCKPVPKDRLMDCVLCSRNHPVDPARLPIHCGDVVLADVCGTGADLIATAEYV